MYQIEIRIVGGNLAASLSGLGLLSESQQKQAVEDSKNYMFTPEKQHLSVFINSGILFAVEHDNKKTEAATTVQLLASLHKQGLIFIESINGVLLERPASKEDKIADDLGQIIFRIETNFQYLKHRIGSVLNQQELLEVQECRMALALDIERLKSIKTRILE